MVYDRRPVEQTEALIYEIMRRRGTSEIDLSYLAGIIDGEGCFSMSFSHRSMPFPRLAVVLSSHEVVQKCHYVTGCGRVTKSKVVTKKGIGMWRWIVSGVQLQALIPKLLPYLILKKPHAQLVMEFYDYLLPLGKSQRAKALPELISIRKALMSINQ